MRIIGISGGVCAGKSTVTKYLASLGVKVVDADKLGHKAYEVGTETYKKVIETFGTGIVSEKDKSINRKELGKIVFSADTEMKKLVGIVWPQIEKFIKQEIADCKDDVIVFEAAVLIEARWDKLMNEVWILECPPEVCLKRLMERNKMPKEKAQKIVNAQISNEERKKYANVVIDSSKTIDEVKTQANKAFDTKPEKK